MASILSLITIVIILLVYNIYSTGRKFKGCCRHRVLHCMAVVGEFYDVRAVIGKFKKGYHVEAQALIDGQWRYIRLTRNNKVRMIRYLNMDWEYTKAYSFDEYLENVKMWRNYKFKENNS